MEPRIYNIPQKVLVRTKRITYLLLINILALLLLTQVYLQDEQKEKAMYVK
jgi:hypothetical protein